MTEAEIIKGCIKHDKNCQKILFEQFYSKMMGICLRYSKDQEEAKNILNEGFLIVFGDIKHFRGGDSLEDWIKKIIVNSAIDYLRNNKHSYWIVNTIKATEPSSEEKNLSDAEILAKVNPRDFLKAVQSLTPAYRVIFNLHFIDKYTYQQISERLDISESTSRSDFTKAKYHIRKNLIRLCNDK